MTDSLRFCDGVTLVGGGVWQEGDLETALARAPHAVAADGGADRLDAIGRTPEAIVGDMDSLRDPDRWAGRTRLLRVTEQDSTDLGKCLYSIDAPFFVGVGFTGGRLDHTLAALDALAAMPDKRLVLIGAEDVIFAPPPVWRIALEPGTRVSLWPLSPVTPVASAGLRWPVDGLALAAGERVGTSNEAIAPQVAITFDHPGAVMILPRDTLDAVLDSLEVGGTG